MNQLFGLGILLNAKDQASASILRVSLALSGLTDQMRKASTTSKTEAEKIKENLNNATSLITSGLGLTTLGGEISNFGVSMLSPIQEVSSKVISTSAQFEQWRMTLKALYKDSEVANQKLAWGLDLASKTPFEVSDVTEALIGFKAVGAEADTMFNNANGQARSFLEYMGDLASLRPDVGLQGVLMGVRNLFGGDGGKSLRMRMDIDLEQVLGRDFGTTTEEIMKDLVEVSDKLANGLMNELDGTWNQMISNLQDQSTKMFLAIGDGGAFDEFKQSLSYVSKTIGSIDDEKLKKLGENIAGAFSLIIKPLNFIIVKVTDFTSKLIDLMATNPLIAKLVVGFTTLLGVATVIIGVLVSLGGVMLIVKGAMMLVAPLLSSLKLRLISFGSSLSLLLPKMALLGIAFALLSTIWKNDMGGIRSGIVGFAQTIQSAFTNSSAYAKMGVADMMNALKQLDTTTFGGWLTYRLTQIKVFWMALVDAWNDYELSDENFQKVSELGLLPLLGFILDLKMRAEQFFKGFIEGWKNIAKVVASIVKFVGEVIVIIGDMIRDIFPVKDAMQEVVDVTDGADFSAWKDLGETIAYMSGVLVGLWAFSKVIAIIQGIGTAFSFVFSIASFIGGIISSVFGAFSSLIGFIGGLLGVIGTIATAVLGFFGIIVTAPAWVVGAITVALALIVGLIFSQWETVKKIISVAVQIIVAIVVGLVVAIIGVFLSIVTIVEFVFGIIATIVMGIVGVIATVGVLIMNVVYAFVGVLVGIILTSITIISNVIQGLVAIVQTVVTFIVGFFQIGFEFIKAVIETFLAIVKAIFTGDFSALAETLKGIWGGFADNVKNIWEGIMSRVQDIWTNFKGYISESWDNLGQHWTNIMDSIKEVASNSVQFVKDIWGGIGSFFSGIWNGIIDSASGMFSWLGNKFSWVSSAISGVKSFFDGGSSSVNEGRSSRMTGNMVGLATGGYVKTEGVAMLHPNEVVVNDDITQKLRAFLESRESVSNQAIPTLEQPQQRVINNVILANNQQEEVTKDLPQRYLVNTTISNNNTTDRTTTSESIDNSITFKEGAIQITMTDGNDRDIDSLVKKIATKLQREQELRRTLNYVR